MRAPFGPPPFQYRAPPGWSAQLVADRDEVIDWRAPAGAEPAAILLLPPLPAAGPLDEQLRSLLPEWTADAEVLETSDVHELAGTALPAKMIAVRLRVTRTTPPRDERRIFVLLSAATLALPLVLPVALIGGPRALVAHEQAFHGLLCSIDVSPPPPFVVD